MPNPMQASPTAPPPCWARIHEPSLCCRPLRSLCELWAESRQLLLFDSSGAFRFVMNCVLCRPPRQVCEERVKDMMTTIANHSEEMLVRGGMAHWMSSDILSVI